MKQLSKQEIIRAWKDANFRNQLSAEQRAALPDHPAGMTELSSAELQEVAGGIDPGPNTLTYTPILLSEGILCMLKAPDLKRTEGFDINCNNDETVWFCPNGQTVGGHYTISN